MHGINGREGSSWAKLQRLSYLKVTARALLAKIGGATVLCQFVTTVSVDSVVAFTEGPNSGVNPKDDPKILSVWRSTCIVRGVAVESRAQPEKIFRALESRRINLIVDEEKIKLKEHTDATQRISEQQRSGKEIVGCQ